MLVHRINAMEQKLDTIAQLLHSLLEDRVTDLDGWLSIEDAMKLTGLGKTKLYELRQTGELEYSSFTGKEKFIRRSSIAALLNRNHREIQNAPLIKPRGRKNDKLI